MLTYDLNGKNKYYTLYLKIRGDILSGKLKRGERLPSKRSLAQNLSISVITVQTAYEQLLAEGYVYSKERSGYYVSDVNLAEGETSAKSKQRVYISRTQNEEQAEETFKLDLVKGGTAAGLFPFSVWAKLMRGVISDFGEKLLQRVPCDGDEDLKRAVSNYLYRARGIEVDPRYIVIGAGAEYLYGIIVQLLGRDKLFAVENPCYRAISACYSLNGAACTPVTVTENGVDCAEVEQSKADVLHLSPSHQFPTGAVTPSSARTRLISWARSGGKFVIEDDYDSEFRLIGKPLQSMYSLCPENVIYMNTFSKSLAPSMRIGYMALPPELYKRYRKLFSSSACAVPVFEQKTLAAMLDGGHFERHINRLKNHYRAVHAAVLEKLQSLGAKCTVRDTGSGLHLLAHFPEAPSDEFIKNAALKNGINLKCLSDYLISPLGGASRFAVINFSGATVSDIKSLEIKF
ncbi:MAG: PLP-dependent aminotransferase family protein [Clostridia bacterium]|nr:PLP-dependent aminotransferase family protein [Clostridia bacterium]